MESQAPDGVDQNPKKKMPSWAKITLTILAVSACLFIAFLAWGFWLLDHGYQAPETASNQQASQTDSATQTDNSGSSVRSEMQQVEWRGYTFAVPGNYAVAVKTEDDGSLILSDQTKEEAPIDTILIRIVPDTFTGGNISARSTRVIMVGAPLQDLDSKKVLGDDVVVDGIVFAEMSCLTTYSRGETTSTGVAESLCGIDEASKTMITVVTSTFDANNTVAKSIVKTMKPLAEQ